MDEKLEAVIKENRQKQEETSRMNIRAGEIVFPIMSKSDWEKWLKERLVGARKVTEIVNFEAIRLPSLDSVTVQKILLDNPDTIQVEGQALVIEYGKGYWGNEYFVRANISEELARSMKIDFVVLPSGRTVEIHCAGHSAKSFPELVEKLEKSRIERCWSRKRQELEHDSWISKPEDVFIHLSKLLRVVEITRSNNGEGEPILGFYSLHADSEPDFKVKVRTTKEEAERETGTSLEKLFKKATKDAMSIPQEEIWQTKGFWSWSLTKLGEELKARLEKLLNENLRDLNTGNIIEKIKDLKQVSVSIKNELALTFS